MDSVRVFILAAGASRRLGKPKQLLRIGNQFLLDVITTMVKNSGFSRITIVLGAHADKIVDKISNTDVEYIFNKNWKEGMGSSFREAMKVVDPEVTAACIFMTCDQIFLSEKILQNMLSAHKENDNHIISCHYGAAFGPPTLFPAVFFPQLRNLVGDRGAKSILIDQMNNVDFVEFPDGSKDIDTLEDFENYRIG